MIIASLSIEIENYVLICKRPYKKLLEYNYKPNFLNFNVGHEIPPLYIEFWRKHDKNVQFFESESK